ncbi:MAG: hypothetical protein NTY53_17085, partial [Kiritimatiellaeota bacterium]|nr:hypothetical protein [Kiritimatiellota bacterium]
MKNWSAAAQRCFEDYCERRRADLLKGGADPDEVFANWRAHVIEETATRAGETVTAEDVFEILTKLDIPAELPTANPPTGAPVTAMSK